MTPRTKDKEEDVLVELAAAAGGLGVGGALTTLVSKVMNRKVDRIDAIERLEQLSSKLTDRAMAHADERVTSAELRVELAEERMRAAELKVTQLDQRMSDYQSRETERESRRHAAVARHVAWDQLVAQRLEDLGQPVSPPPPLE